MSRAVDRRVLVLVCGVSTVNRNAASSRVRQGPVLEKGGWHEPRMRVYVLGALHTEYSDVATFALFKAVYCEVWGVNTRVVVSAAAAPGSMGDWADGIGILAKKAPNDLILVG